MENRISKLIELVQKLPESCLDKTIDFVTEQIEENAIDEPVPACPHCKSENAKRNGRKNDRQRYRCNDCGKTFGVTTNTALYQSPYGEAVWKQVISDTVDGVSLDDTAESLHISHATAFHMRHKILCYCRARMSRNSREEMSINRRKSCPKRPARVVRKKQARLLPAE